MEVVFNLRKELRLSSILKKLRSSSILKKIEVVFHISSSWIKIMFHTENHFPTLPRTARNVMIPGVVVWVNITDNNNTPGYFVLG